MYSAAARPPRFDVAERSVAYDLLAHCQANDWSGHDPFDALNSRLLTRLPVLNFRLPRLVLTQALKRSPINIRSIACIPRTQNPKAMALFLAALLELEDLDASGRGSLVSYMLERLIALRSPDGPYWCWGYSFPWQTRTIVVPRWTPNVVCTSFVADALLDMYEQRQVSRCLAMAVSAADYVLNELYWTDGGSAAGFAYPLRSQQVPIHNANLVAAAFLCRVYQVTGERRFLDPALRVARYSAAHQHEDGSWTYGEARTQQWIDNFHTGYNLCALAAIGRRLETREFEPNLLRGFRFYRNRFFRADGAPRYYHDRTYPIDIHCVAQSIITLSVLRHLDPTAVPLAGLVFRWAMEHMWDRRGFFYYRVLRLGTIRTSYMRWSQAWMLRAIATLLRATSTALASPKTRPATASA